MSTAAHLKRSVDLAEKISAKAEEALADIEREMILNRWPDDFRAIMWETISTVALSRAAQRRKAEEKGK